MLRRIIDRIQCHRGITLSLILGLILLMPAWARASRIAISGTTRALREEASTSSLPVSASSLIGILQAGTLFSETNTTTFNNGSTQIADITIVPDTSNSTVTTSKDITLADGDREKVLEVAAISGNTVTQTVTTTLPSSAIQTKAETDVTNGDKTVVKGTVSMPGGGTQTIAGQTIQSGSQSVTTLTIINRAGHVYHDRITVTHDGAFNQTETNTTQGPGGSLRTVKSTTDTVLKPSGAVPTEAAQFLSIPAPRAPAQALHLEARPGAFERDRHWVCRAAAAEPSTLMFIVLVLDGRATSLLEAEALGERQEQRLSRPCRSFAAWPGFVTDLQVLTL